MRLTARADLQRVGGVGDEIFPCLKDADVCARHWERSGRVEVARGFADEHAGASPEPRPYVHLDAKRLQSVCVSAARHGRRAQTLGLYALLVGRNVPRMLALLLTRRLTGHPKPESISRFKLHLPFPGRVNGGLGAMR